MEQLEKIELTTGGYFEGWSTYTIDFNEYGMANVRKESKYHRDDDSNYTITMNKNDSLLLQSKIEKWNVENWGKEYLDINVLDGENWQLSYQLRGKRARKHSGSNDFPAEWRNVVETLGWLDCLSHRKVEED